MIWIGTVTDSNTDSSRQNDRTTEDKERNMEKMDDEDEHNDDGEDDETEEKRIVALHLMPSVAYSLSFHLISLQCFMNFGYIKFLKEK
ncbi:unnamed protein product [Thelazia callipaeda]|uniref:Ovule protein n=1 Tax=Thelazia callipaeda TaxID=103827 RepID=A0A0N5DBD7_THECL|nr:unnamed protein product [Thelazia callipaeda]